MGVFMSSLKDKKALYQKQADDLKARAEELRKNKNFTEASRLEDLGQKAQDSAVSLDEQI